MLDRHAKACDLVLPGADATTVDSHYLIKEMPPHVSSLASRLRNTKHRSFCYRHVESDATAEIQMCLSITRPKRTVPHCQHVSSCQVMWMCWNLFQALPDRSNACLWDVEVANDQPFHPQANAKLVVIEKLFYEDLYLALSRMDSFEV